MKTIAQTPDNSAASATTGRIRFRGGRGALFAALVWGMSFQSIGAASADTATISDLERFTGNYAYSRDQTMRIVRKDDHLVAEPSGNFPSLDLYAQSVPGKFAARGANFVFRFLTDPSGKITALEITGPGEIKRNLPRIADTQGATESLQSLAIGKSTSVKAGVYNAYERTRGPDGKFGPETIAFHEGGFQGGNPTRDQSIETITFEEIAKAIAPSLAEQGYVAATEVEKTDLLLMVYWGTTATEDHPAVRAEEEFDPTSHVFRDQINRKNSRLLGFEDPLKETEWAIPGTGASSKASDLMGKLQENRYWVAIIAFDFPTVRDERSFKLLWFIRYNMPSRGANFPDALPQMTKIASHLFGQDSKGLVVNAAGEIETTVDYGELEVIDVDEEETQPAESQR